MTDRRTSILIVDDEPRNLRLIEGMLRSEGHVARRAGNAAEALAAVAQQAPDLILLDVMLPDLSGFEVATLLKANPKTKTIPIIMVTALDDRMSKLAGLNSGAEEFISKPVDRAELLIRVRNLLRLKEYSDSLVHHNRTLEQLVTERTATLAGESQERRRLEQEILKISDHEQQRIGRDLHDSVCQQLTGIELMSHALNKSLTSHAPAQAEQAGHMAFHMRAVIGEVRMIARGLCPVIVEPDGLMAALPELADSVTRMFAVRCVFSCPETVLVHDSNTATNLYRIAQEAISNAIRHGHARHVEVRLSANADHLTLTIKDDGRGMPPPPIRMGLGLGIMRYRANLIGGRLSIEPVSSGGTTVTCRFPKTHGENNREAAV